MHKHIGAVGGELTRDGAAPGSAGRAQHAEAVGVDPGLGLPSRAERAPSPGLEPYVFPESPESAVRLRPFATFISHYFALVTPVPKF